MPRHRRRRRNPDAEKLTYDHYGLPVYRVDGQEFAVGSDKQATAAAKRMIANDVWAFRPEFIANYVTDGIEADTIKSIQESKYEDATKPIRALIGSRWSKFVRAALAADGRGHFLSQYDGEERRSDDIPGLPPGKVAFRIN